MTPSFLDISRVLGSEQVDTHLEPVIRAFGRPKPPETITQQAIDWETDQYPRLCALMGRLPRRRDLFRYIADIEYKEIQVDFFLYMAPICLEAWQMDLMSYGNSRYPGLMDWFCRVLSKHEGFRNILTGEQYDAVWQFIAGVILDQGQ